MAKVGEGLAYIDIQLRLIAFTWDMPSLKVVASSRSKPLKTVIWPIKNHFYDKFYFKDPP